MNKHGTLCIGHDGETHVRCFAIYLGGHRAIGLTQNKGIEERGLAIFFDLKREFEPRVILGQTYGEFNVGVFCLF